MKLYQCDFCGEQKPCGAVTIDHKKFDICKECKEQMDKKLKDKGEVAYFQPILQPYIWYYPYSYYISQPIYVQPTLSYTYTSFNSSTNATAGSSLSGLTGGL